MIKRRSWLVAAILLAAIACSHSKGHGNLPDIKVDAGDAGKSDAAASDASKTGDAANDADLGPDTGAIVQVDLSDYLPAPTGAQVSKVYQLQGAAPFSGPVTTGTPGDWVLENDVARFLVEGDKRAMSPCPWGGDVIDAAYTAAGNEEDLLGEVCLVANGGITFRPDRFDVIHDGSDGGAAVLAASGHMEVNDFLNLPVMVGDFAASLQDKIGFDVNKILPLRITKYFILRPGENDIDVVTGFRNDSDAQVDMLPAYMLSPGGNGYYFNPLSPTGGFGTSGGTPDSPVSFGVDLDDLSFVAFNGKRASYAFAPKPNPDIPPNLLPISGSYIVISGVAATILNTASGKLLNVLTAPKDVIPNLPEVMHVAPGETQTVDYRLYVGDGALSTMIDPMYSEMGVDTATITGTVHDTDGNPVGAARVTAMRRGFRTMNQTISAADGTFTMTVPPETYEVRARKDGMAPTADVEAVVAAGQSVNLPNVQVDLPATIRVHVTTPDDGCADTNGPQPVPARLTIVCDGDCPNKPTLKEADVTFHHLPTEFAAVVFGKPDGLLEAQVPPGDYRLVVSRGIEWSMWPSDATSSLGMPVTVGPGETVDLDAEIAKVVDTGDSYAGDYHVHSISSPDSPTTREQRIRDFLAEGVDVIVSTDHDFISDYAPTIQALGAGKWIQSIIGEEVTTADLGHFNGFPLQQSDSNSRGGSIDWGNGSGYTLTPKELYAKINAFPGEQVVQLNHASSLGLIRYAQADVLHGLTYADRGVHRLPPQAPDPMTGDTGFWSDDFTAMELMNGTSRGRFYRLGRWWMQMVGRGFTPTGTAVTDTHYLYADLGGVPRTYVWGEDMHDCGARPFDKLTDSATFVKQYSHNVNLGHAIGTTGPFFDVHVHNGAGDMARPGDSIAYDTETVATVDLQMPEWMKVNAIDVYVTPDLATVMTRPGEIIDDPIPPTVTVPVTLDPATDLKTVVTGAVDHKEWHKSIDIPLTMTNTSTDGFVVFVVKGNKSEWPLVRNKPFGFSNPVYLDVDGNGYDHPPYAAAAAMPPTPGEQPPCLDSSCGTRKLDDPNHLTPKDIIDIIHHSDCRYHAASE